MESGIRPTLHDSHFLTWTQANKRGTHLSPDRSMSRRPHSDAYFSLLGGTRPFNRRYMASVEYCSLSCKTVPQISPARDRLFCPAVYISVKFASVVAANALSHSANEAFSPAMIASLSAVSEGVFTISAGAVWLATPQLRACASVTWFTTRANVRTSRVGSYWYWSAAIFSAPFTLLLLCP